MPGYGVQIPFRMEAWDFQPSPSLGLVISERRLSFLCAGSQPPWTGRWRTSRPCFFVSFLLGQLYWVILSLELPFSGDIWPFLHARYLKGLLPSTFSSEALPTDLKIYFLGALIHDIYMVHELFYCCRTWFFVLNMIKFWVFNSIVLSTIPSKRNSG